VVRPKCEMAGASIGRAGRIVILRGEVLGFGVVRVDDLGGGGGEGGTECISDNGDRDVWRVSVVRLRWMWWMKMSGKCK
jgi:hypothetical protein